MRSHESNVSIQSDYYIYTASATAKKMFFYPLHTGYFYYEPGYRLRRNNFNSFLIMLITKGSCKLRINDNNTYTASKGDVVLVDCYSSHEYGSNNSWESSWLHFDGQLAREYYEHIVSRSGNIIIPRSTQTVEHGLNKICNIFRNGSPIREASISKYITNILTELLLSGTQKHTSSNLSIVLEDTISYINENFTEQLSIQSLAKRASLSPYYFIRVFTKETGMTPHQYLINTRLNSAKFLLKSTDISIKEIAFNSGFLSESSFCSTFKKWEHVTPSEYRALDSI